MNYRLTQTHVEKWMQCTAEKIQTQKEKWRRGFIFPCLCHSLTYSDIVSKKILIIHLTTTQELFPEEEEPGLLKIKAGLGEWSDRSFSPRLVMIVKTDDRCLTESGIHYIH